MADAIMETSSIGGKDAIRRIPVADVIFREDLYPRIKHDPATVQKYAEDLDVLPPIEVNQHLELIDGWHRWTAHRKAEAETIPAKVTETTSEAQFLALAITRNASHGLQLSQEDKRDMAARIYLGTPVPEREAKKAELAHLLSVSLRVVQDWLSRIDKDEKDRRDKRILEMHMRCFTHEEIAQAENIGHPTVVKVLSENADLRSLTKPQTAAAEHATEDFDPPLYNVWTQAKKSEGSKHFGNSEVRWLDNLLYAYTEPFDIVVDPFAGGGSTLDICRRRWRRCWIADRKPIVERAKDIRRHDLVKDDGSINLPPLNKRWSDVSLVYLDPPYWKQAEGQYSDDPTDLANMELEEFHATLAKIINGFLGKVRGENRQRPGHVALVLQPTQWKAPERAFTDHVAEMIRRVKAPIAMRISVPYATEQYNAQQVEWAKANREWLVLTREIVVWRA